MSKNLLYAIFLHLAVIILFYSAFNFKDFEDDAPKVTVSFNIDPETPIKPEELPQAAREEVVEPKIPPKEIKKPKEVVKKEEIKPVEKPKEIVKKEEIKKPAPKPKEEIKAPQAPTIKEDNKKKEEKTEEKSPENSVKIAATKTAPVVENTIEQLNLSAREKFNIQSQLKRCYKKAVAENKGSSEILVTVKITISQDGYLKSNLEEVVDQNLYKSSQGIAYKVAIDNARSAIRFCNPLRNLPADKFDTWKDITLQFDGKND